MTEIEKNRPLISFIIPVLNEEKNLAETIRPLKSLNWLNKEIIVADGGSTDQTVAIAKQLADKVYERLSGQKNKSIAENRNKGASLANGRFLFFIDCGVKIERFPDFVREVLKIMAAKPKLVGLTSEIRFFPHEENKVDRMNLWVINKTIKNLNKIRLGVAMGWVQVVRAEAFKKINGYDEDLITPEDLDLFRRLNKIGRTMTLKNFVAFGSAERYHREGWPKMISLFFTNWLSYVFRGKSISKEWKSVEKDNE